METKYYKSLKTGETAELVGKNEHGVILLLKNGEERILASSTLKRWWKAVDNTPKKTTIKQEVTQVKETTDTQLPNVHKQFIISMEQFSEAVGSEIFIRPTTKSYNLRKDGRIYLFFKLTKKGVVLYVKSKAIGDGFTYTEVNHNFDAKIVFDEWNTTVYNKVRKLHDLSLKYQATRNSIKK